MGSIKSHGRNAWRKYVVDGVAASGVNQPDTIDIFPFVDAVDAAVGAVTGGFIGKDTKANLDADLAHAAGTLALVYADPTPANNTTHVKSGASGSGAWTAIPQIAEKYLILDNAGAGTGNAIVLTSTLALPSGAYGGKFLSRIIDANGAGGVTIAINGGSAKSLVTNSGNAIADGYLTAGMVIEFVDDGTNYRLTSDVASAAIQAAAEAAAATVQQFLPSVMEFADYDYIDAAQITHIRNNDIASQTAATVTAGLNDLFDAVATWLDGADERTAIVWLRGSYLCDDEVLTETFTQTQWDSTRLECRMQIFGGKLYAQFADHKAVRTSGLWDDAGIADAVPAALLRWENQAKTGWRLDLANFQMFGVRSTNDPIGLKVRNLNDSHWHRVVVEDFYNVGYFEEDVNNSKKFDIVVKRCGFQPTELGGDGFIDSGVTFSTTNNMDGTSTVTASSSIFTADHVGRWFLVQDAGEGGTVFSAQITAQSGTTATVDEECATDVTGKKGSFLTLRGDFSGDTSLALKVGLTEDLTGRYIFGYRAGSTAHSVQDVLATIVTAHDVGSTGKAVTLMDAAANTASDLPVIVNPCVYIGRSELADTGGHNNDTQYLGMTIEHSFDEDFGSAVPLIAQNVLASQFIACKLHGTDQAYNNFAAAEFNLVLDNCKNFQSWGFQFSHCDWSPEYGNVLVCGLESAVWLDNMQVGSATPMDRKANLYIDPQGSDPDNCQVFISGRVASANAGWGLANQAFARYGSNGDAEMLSASGPLITRDEDDWPDMPPFRVRTLNVKSGWVSWTPALYIGGADITAGGGTYAAATASYKIIDDIAYVRIKIQLSAEGTNTGNATIPLPAAITPAEDDWHLGVAEFVGMTALYGFVLARTDTSDGLQLARMNSGATETTPITQGNTTNTTRIEISGCFRIA